MKASAKVCGFAFQIALLLGLDATSSAQGHLTRGIELLDEGMFEEAGAALDQSLAEETLDRDELIQLFVHRALVRSAAQEDPEPELLRLASLNPGGASIRRLPPTLRSIVENALADPGPIGLDVDSDMTPGGIQMRVRVTRDVGALTNELRLRARQRGQPWVEGASRLSLPATDEREIEFVAEAIGPGGAVIAWRGTEAEPEPLRSTVPTDNPDPLVAPPPQRSRAGLWVGVTVLIVALAAGAAVTGILVKNNQEANDTQLGMPMVEFP